MCVGTEPGYPTILLGQKNKAVFSAHRVTKINPMRAAAKLIYFSKYVQMNIVGNVQNMKYQSYILYITGRYKIRIPVCGGG